MLTKKHQYPFWATPIGTHLPLKYLSHVDLTRGKQTRKAFEGGVVCKPAASVPHPHVQEARTSSCPFSTTFHSVEGHRLLAFPSHTHSQHSQSEHSPTDSHDTGRAREQEACFQSGQEGNCQETAGPRLFWAEPWPVVLSPNPVFPSTFLPFHTFSSNPALIPFHPLPLTLHHINSHPFPYPKCKHSSPPIFL